MAQDYKTLVQLTPSANVTTNLYQTSASSQAVIGTITISGLFATTNGSFSLSVRPINEALSNEHFFFRGSPILSNDILVVSGAITMGPNTILQANTSVATTDFTVFGVEIT